MSDESQLYTGMPTQEKEDLIKPLLINSMNDGRVARFRSVINRSSLLVFFGTSIGTTDKYIWEYIIGWLNEVTDRRIIIHVHDASYTESVRRSSRRHKQFVDSVQDKLLGHSKVDDSLKEKLKKQIFVIHNTKKLFVPINNK